MYGPKIPTLVFRGVMGNIALDFGDPLKSNGRQVTMTHDDLSEVIDAVV